MSTKDPKLLRDARNAMPGSLFEVVAHGHVRTQCQFNLDAARGLAVVDVYRRRERGASREVVVTPVVSWGPSGSVRGAGPSVRAALQCAAQAAVAAVLIADQVRRDEGGGQ